MVTQIPEESGGYTGTHAGYSLIAGIRQEDAEKAHKGALHSLIESAQFQTCIALVIIANAAVIGFETDYPDPRWELVEDIFLVVFALELMLRIYVYRVDFLTIPDHRAWNAFDAIIVASGVIGDVIEEDRELTKQSEAHGRHGQHKQHSGEIAILLRIFRLLRILRIFRLFKMFKQLYMLASGFIEATAAIFWVSVLCALCLYVCAIMLTRLLGHPALKTRKADPDGEHPNVDFMLLHFGDVEKSMFTLFELMAHPNIEEYSLVMTINPYMKAFFVIFIIFGSFAMLSLLTGVISETMIEKSQQQKEEVRWHAEQDRMKFVEQLRRIFIEADADGDGQLSMEEFQACKAKISGALDIEGAEVDQDLDKVYEVIDFDGSGSVDVDEFLDGMVRAKSDLRTMHVMQLQYMVRKAQTDLETRIDSVQTEITQRVTSIEAGLELIHSAFVRSTADKVSAGSPNVGAFDLAKAKVLPSV